MPKETVKRKAPAKKKAVPKTKPAATKRRTIKTARARSQTPVKKIAAKERAGVKKIQKKIARSRNPIVGFALLMTSAVIIILTVVSYLMFFKPVVSAPREFVVSAGSSVSSVARDLDQGSMLKFLVRMRGNKVMAGMYDLPAGASVWRIARMISRGEVASTAVTIPEGLTIKQIVNLLNANQFLTGKTLGDYNDGELFPSTYIVAKGTSRAAVLDLMAKKMERIRSNFENSRAYSLPYPLKDWSDVVILASIVQKETGKKEEMPLVASVYINRLRKKMRLQACPTVVYVITNRLGDMQEKTLYARYLRVKSPYNTYRNAGLPPAPIANVGMDAIRAVLNPADTNYLYFVADGSGGHKFSDSLSEHNQNHEIWRAIKQSRN